MGPTIQIELTKDDIIEVCGYLVSLKEQLKMVARGKPNEFVDSKLPEIERISARLYSQMRDHSMGKAIYLKLNDRTEAALAQCIEHYEKMAEEKTGVKQTPHASLMFEAAIIALANHIPNTSKP